MGVDLGCVLHAGGREPEGFDRPVEIGLPVCPAQRQSFAKRRLVDLDHHGTRLLQVHDLVADGKSDLATDRRSWKIVANERPVENGDRAGEHALDRTLRQRLCILPPRNGHRTRPGDVAVDDRRADIARAVALHPCMPGEGEARKLLAEILHHVVALELAMHQHVEVDLFLPADRGLRFLFQERLVVGIAQLAPGIGRACLAHLGRLGERADRRRREQRQGNFCRLLPAPLGEGAAPPRHCFADAGEPAFDQRIVHLGRRRAPACSILRRLELRKHGAAAFRQRARQHDQLVLLLDGKGQPRLYIRVERGFEFEIDRDMQQ